MKRLSLLLFVTIFAAALLLVLYHQQQDSQNPARLNVRLTPQRIAAEAPKDVLKRQTLRRNFCNTAQQIEEKHITDRGTAWAVLTMETASVIADPQWKPTVQRIERELAEAKELDAFAQRLKDIGEAF